MSYINSSWTGRAVRDLESAFGVRSSQCVIEPMRTDPPMHKVDVIVLRASALGGIALAFFMAWGWVK